MSRYIPTTEVAQLVRAALRKAFPGVKFSVRSRSYSLGSSIDVYWTDGPTAAAVDQLVGLYTGGRFDGMTDSKTHVESLLVLPGRELPELVSFGVDSIHTHRALSPRLRERLLSAAATVTGLSADELEGPTYLEVPAQETTYGWFGGGTAHTLKLFLAEHIG